MDDRAIGVFDSGVGGLTAVKELRAQMPGEDIVYFGDTGRVPYGSRSRATIVKYTRQDVAFLRSRGVKMLIAACGTVSSVAAHVLEEQGMPFAVVLRPTVEAALAATRNRRVGVIGTAATIRSGSYRRELERLSPGVQVFEQSCPLFVPLVESGCLGGDEITALAAERYLSPLRRAGIDTLILGCTHYPVIREAIGRAAGPGVTLIDSGRETARYAARLLGGLGLLHAPGHRGTCRFFVSDHIEDFSSVAGIYLGGAAALDVEYVDIDRFPAE